MVAVGSNFFCSMTLPVTLWFLDRGKAGTPREKQIEFLGNAVRLYRGEEPERAGGENAQLAERFPDGSYADVKGLSG